ncbi:hypothetical protein [Providencia sp.]|uniref:hypothetical protein n=1 Tax=Providencia sp. TaxID=589 RepID=UPI0035B1846A
MELNLKDLWEVVKYFIPFAITFIVWAINYKRDNVLKNLTILKESKSVLSGDAYSILERTLTNEIISKQIKVKNDAYLKLGAILVSNKILTPALFRSLIGFLEIKNNKVKFKVNKSYFIDYYMFKFFSFSILLVSLVYILMSVSALDALILGFSEKPLSGKITDFLRVILLSFSVLILFWFAVYFNKIRPKINEIIFINTQIDKLNIPNDTYVDITRLANKKRLTKSKTLDKFKSMILPLRRH